MIKNCKPTTASSRAATPGIADHSAVVLIPAGEFLMGAEDGSPAESRVHRPPTPRPHRQTAEQTSRATRPPPTARSAPDTGVPTIAAADAAPQCPTGRRHAGTQGAAGRPVSHRERVR